MFQTREDVIALVKLVALLLICTGCAIAGLVLTAHDNPLAIAASLIGLIAWFSIAFTSP